MRGMMKWLPFKSLSNQYKILDDHKREAEKVTKPELSEDEIEDMNNLLVSLNRGDRISVTYFDDGRILTLIDDFRRADPLERKLFLSKCGISFDSLLNLKRS